MRGVRLVTAGVLLTAGSGVAHADYDFSPVADPAANGFTVAQGINDGGEIVGFYRDAGNVQHGFLLTGGVYTPIDVPGAATTQANGINNAGVIAGYSTTGGTTSGYVRTGGTFSPVVVPGSTGTNAWGINNAGTVSGYYTVGAGTHGFVDSGGTFTAPLDDPAGVPGSTTVLGINGAGTVVGYYNDVLTGFPHGFTWSPGSGFVTLDDPLGIGGTKLSGINDSGEVVGTYIGATGSEAFVESGGLFTTLDVPMALDGFTQGFGINNLGDIVGQYIDSSTGFTVGFEATPALPEPASFAILGLALAGLAAARRHRA
jgi:hypothetical protein